MKERSIDDIPRLQRHARAITLLVLIVIGVAGWLGNLYGQHLSDWAQRFGLFVFGLAAACLALVIAYWLIGELLRGRSSVLGVAQTVIYEALRMKVGLVFVALLLLLVPMLPFVITADQPLRYRIQNFLHYSMFVSGVLLSVMTVLLACWTLSNEVAERQIHTIAVKPIGRGAYLFGKWLGIMLLNAVLLTIVAAAIYSFTVFYLADLPKYDNRDKTAIENELLTARTAVKPIPSQPFENVARQRLAELEQRDVDTIKTLGQQAAQSRGLSALDEQTVMLLGRARAFEQLLDQVRKQWKSIPRGGYQAYVFENLFDAARESRPLQLRYKIRTSRSLSRDEVKLVVIINGQQGQMVSTVGQMQVLHDIRPEFIGPDGRLTLDVAHRHPGMFGADAQATVTFEEMELYYQVGRFGPNFARAMVIMWVKLGFLAMLGLAAATFLSFPVAALGGMMIYIIASASGFLVEALKYYGPEREAGVVVLTITSIIKGIGYACATVLGKFAEFTPSRQIVDGQYISWLHVAGCGLWIAVVWTGLTAAIAYAIFRKRELARVQV